MVTQIPTSISWSYLHFLGCTHRDLFAIFADATLRRTIESETWENPGRILSLVFQKIPLTDERKAKIHSGSLNETFSVYRTKIEDTDIRILLYSDMDFPQELHNIPNPPFLLYVRGNIVSEGINIGMVGSRQATPYGEQIVKSFIPKLVRAGISIVSGGALGIDGLSHETALQYQGHTIVVLGSGIDRPYPRSHEPLFERVIRSGGAVVSQFPIGMEAAPYTFPQRNEIIAGLSRGLIVVEAKEKSGSLITAQLALEMGKDVFAIPSDISRRNSLGANRLIQNASAKLLLSPDDILNEYGLSLATSVAVPNSENSLERNILIVLDGNECTVDRLAEALRANTTEIQAELGKMEIFGTIRRNISGKYSLSHD